MKNKKLSIFLLALLVMITGQPAYGFDYPTGVPPAGDVPQLINVDSRAQKKNGDLTVKNLKVNNCLEIGGALKCKWPVYTDPLIINFTNPNGSLGKHDICLLQSFQETRPNDRDWCVVTGDFGGDWAVARRYANCIVACVDFDEELKAAARFIGSVGVEQDVCDRNAFNKVVCALNDGIKFSVDLNADRVGGGIEIQGDIIEGIGGFLISVPGAGLQFLGDYLEETVFPSDPFLTPIVSDLIRAIGSGFNVVGEVVKDIGNSIKRAGEDLTGGVKDFIRKLF